MFVCFNWECVGSRANLLRHFQKITIFLDCINRIIASGIKKVIVLLYFRLVKTTTSITHLFLSSWAVQKIGGRLELAYELLFANPGFVDFSSTKQPLIMSKATPMCMISARFVRTILILMSKGYDADQTCKHMSHPGYSAWDMIAWDTNCMEATISGLWSCDRE